MNERVDADFLAKRTAGVGRHLAERDRYAAHELVHQDDVIAVAVADARDWQRMRLRRGRRRSTELWAGVGETARRKELGWARRYSRRRRVRTFFKRTDVTANIIAGLPALVASQRLPFCMQVVVSDNRRHFASLLRYGIRVLATNEFVAEFAG